MIMSTHYCIVANIKNLEIAEKTWKKYANNKRIQMETKSMEIGLKQDKVTIIKRPLKENNAIRNTNLESEITSLDSQVDKKEKGGLETIMILPT